MSLWKRIGLLRSHLTSSIKSRRQFGGNSSHGHSDPHSAPHFEPYPDQAYPFGRKPGSPLEGWEWITFGVYSAVILIAFKRTFIDEKKDDIKVINSLLLIYVFFTISIYSTIFVITVMGKERVFSS